MDEHFEQEKIAQSTGKITKAHKVAKARMRVMRRKALSIVEQVLPWLEKCCEEFCSDTGIG